MMEKTPLCAAFRLSFLLFSVASSSLASRCVPPCVLLHEVCKANLCDCSQGYFYLGNECIRDPCLSNPCQNDGICARLGSSFTCTCLPGFEGPTCGINSAEVCENNQCLNGGTCRRGTCECTDGFRGERCEIECASVLLDIYWPKCHLNGTCSFLSANRSMCSCNAPHFIGNGTHCTLVPNDTSTDGSTNGQTSGDEPTTTEDAWTATVKTTTGAVTPTTTNEKTTPSTLITVTVIKATNFTIAEDDSSLSTESDRVGKIVGITFGIAIGVVITLISIFLWHRKKKKGQMNLNLPTAEFYTSHDYETLKFGSANKKACSDIVAEDSKQVKLAAVYETMKPTPAQLKNNGTKHKNIYDEPKVAFANESTPEVRYDKPAVVPSSFVLENANNGYYAPGSRAKSGSQLSATQSEDGYELPIQCRSPKHDKS
ncbi:uncharacterized protein [Oscarella lobularis]|uniref:uncharacterized protein n=1 Tax=Oscarella lobularis TaxID=121494 RepID=UPI003313D64E